MLVFDLETGALPEEQLREVYTPLDESQIEGVVTGDFDPKSVRVGNLKDQGKIDTKIAEAKQAHDSAKSNSASIIASAKEKHWKEFVSKAALSPLTGQILVIALHGTEKGQTVVAEKPESELLKFFWTKYEECRGNGRKMVGHNIAGFDVPFLVRRSWMLDIPVPSTVFDKGKWLDSSTLVDTLSLWKCGTTEGAKLDVLCRAFGIGGKTEGCSGAEFAKLYRGTAEEKAKALEYAANDAVITAKLATRMGVV